MKKLLILLSLLICSCAMETANEIPPEDIFPVVINVYSENIKEVSQECEEYVNNIVVLETDEVIPGTTRALSDSGNQGMHVAWNGVSYVWCAYHYDADIVNTCYGHEALHALHGCMTGDRDGDHSEKSLWCDRGKVCVNFLGTVTNSVEFKVTSILQVMAR